ncbi:helix-turn-helix domain-containing protein [Marinobacterium sp. D7]|uniref:helix-turn-helix domain-containing protein n=1 Tax=Marinobacterium ramblicola TaxID=2849041 RepID=UPI001C2D3F87|nr:helix-turn-helix domain-containing protein [Marinobacterium ramblicola]MBV1790563.1 helix-turn-helix domain-containing protein [Marinobacterium ramblicola]
MKELIGVGIYSIPEAAALTGIESRKIRRWLFDGPKQPGTLVGANALWTPELADADVGDNISFHDLLEVRFVDAFRQHGVSLQSIRAAAAHAKEFFASPYPFTCQKFLTDGRSIFADTLEETGDESLMDLVKKQYVFKQIVSHSLYAGIEYNDNQLAARWFPIPRSRKVVLDPSRAFGKPILHDYGITTEALYSSWQAEDSSIKRVSDLFEIPKDLVEAAINFEQRIAANEVLH